MKLYEYPAFPNPRRVRIFLAEKGIPFQSITVDVPAGEHRGEAFRKINPWAGVPVLELEDGTHIAETQAICKYLEAIQPGPALMGRNPKEQAVVEMWQRRIEQNLFEKLVSYFHYATPGLGDLEPHRNDSYGQFCAAQAQAMLEKLERELEQKEFIAGEFSVADITALCALDFAHWLELAPSSEFEKVHAWHRRLSDRPSARA